MKINADTPTDNINELLNVGRQRNKRLMGVTIYCSVPLSVTD